MGAISAWPRAVIFDLDGTLVDTAADIAAVLNATLKELGLPPHSLEAVRPMIGGGLEKLLDRALEAHGVTLTNSERKEASALLFALYAGKPVQLSELYPGAADALRRLRDEGIACAVCTNKPEAISGGILRAFGLREIFRCLQCGDGDLPKKPDPAGLLAVTRTLGVTPLEAVMVGDSRSDLEAARAGGLGAAVLVSYGYTETPASELGADLVIDHLADLPDGLARLAATQESRGARKSSPKLDRKVKARSSPTG